MSGLLNDIWHYLIATTDGTIDDISDEVGYVYQTSFNQAFRKAIEMQ